MQDHSITNRLLSPVWDRLARLIPPTVAPNMLHLISMLLVVQAWYLSVVYSALYPSPVTVAVIVLLSAFYAMNSCAGRHARVLRQHTPLSELFGYAMDNVTTVFLALAFCTLLDVDVAPTVETQWYVVMGAQLVLFTKHLSAQKRASGIRYSVLGGPGEALTVILIFLAGRATVGVDYGPAWLLRAWTALLARLSVWVAWAGAALPFRAEREEFEAFAKSYRAQIGQRLSDGVDELTDAAQARFGFDAAGARRTAREVQDSLERAAEQQFGSYDYRDPVKVAGLSCRVAFYAFFVVALVQVALLGRRGSSLRRQAHYKWTRFALGVCLLLRFIPALLFASARATEADAQECASHARGDGGAGGNQSPFVGLGDRWLTSWLQTEAQAAAAERAAKCAAGAAAVEQSAAAALSLMDVLLDGLFLAMLTTDVALSKMGRRGLHPWMVVMSVACASSHFMAGICVVFYYTTVFADLGHYMNLPLLTPCRNVYCDGVYDLCHIGHKNAFRNALAFGNRLFVGVCNDEDCSQYKRPPIMTHAERCAEVEACKSVTKVIPNAPCFGISKEFLDKHQIHVVAMGQEYVDKWPDPKDDKYYGVPRAMGIARVLPRTPGLSTSELIKRVKAATLDKKSET